MSHGFYGKGNFAPKNPKQLQLSFVKATGIQNDAGFAWQRKVEKLLWLVAKAYTASIGTFMYIHINSYMYL